MAFDTVSGSTLACTISVPAAYDDDGYGALSYTAIGEIADIGTGYGRSYAASAHSPIAVRKGTTKKASYNLSDVKLTMAWDQSDAGQDLLRTAELDDSVLAFKLVKQNGDIRYFSAQVSQFTEAMGAEDNVDVGSVVLLFQTNLSEPVPPVTVFATFDPDAKSARITLSNGNLTATCDGTNNFQLAKSTIYKSTGKWYVEFHIDTAGVVCNPGIANASAVTNVYLGFDLNGYSYQFDTGQFKNNNIAVGAGATYATGDIISALFDGDAGTLIFWKNGVPQGAAITGITGSWCPAVSGFGAATVITANFGASAFTYTPPAGYEGWSS